MKTKQLLPLFVAALLAMICVRQATAHAILFEASPAPNSIVSGQSVTVKLRFNVRIDADRSRLVLVCPGGSMRPLQIKSQEPADTVVADVSGLVTGSYDLKWQVLASDGHITRGDIPFVVK